MRTYNYTQFDSVHQYCVVYGSPDNVVIYENYVILKLGKENLHKVFLTIIKFLN